jgi:glutathione S-transferase
MKFLEEYFLKDRDFIGGQSPSIADFTISTLFSILRVDDQTVLTERVKKYIKDMSDLYKDHWEKMQA